MMLLELNEEQEKLLVRLYESMLSNSSWCFSFVPLSLRELEIFRSLESVDLVYMPSSLLGFELYVLSPIAMEILYSLGKTLEIVSVLNFFFAKDKKVWKLEELQDFQNESQILENVFVIALYYANSLNYVKLMRKNNPFPNSLPDSLIVTLFGEKFFTEPFVIGGYIKLDMQYFKNNFTNDDILNWIENSASGSEDFELEFKTSDDFNDLRKIVSCFSNSHSGVLCIGFNDDGSVCGLRISPDKMRNRIITNLKDISNKDIEFRVLTDLQGEKALVVLIAKRDEPVLIGDIAYRRIGASCEKVEKLEEIIKLAKDLESEPSGHLWLKSLKKYI